jgi:hypothetical protein
MVKKNNDGRKKSQKEIIRESCRPHTQRSFPQPFDKKFCHVIQRHPIKSREYQSAGKPFQ